MTQPIAGWETYTDPLGQQWPHPVTDPMSGAPATPPAPSPFVPVQQIDPSARPNVQPVPGSEQYSGDSYRPAGTLPGLGAAAPNAIPALTPGGADTATPVQAPDLQPGHADRGLGAQPAFVPQTTTESTTTTQGLDKASAAGIGKATDQANAAAQASGQAMVDQKKAEGQLEQTQAQRAYGQGVNDYFQNAAALQVQDDIIEQTSARLEDVAKFKPDRTALFKGDHGVLFGISAAISAMAGGWLMGQGLTGGKNPYLDSVMRMIDDNARDQVESNSLVYQELTKRLGSAQAAQKELKARMLGAVNDTIEAQSRFEKGELVQKGSAGVMAQVQAEQAKNNLEREKLVAKTVSTSVQRRTQMVANPAATGGIDINDPKEYAKVGKVKAVTDFASDAESLAKTGELASSVGLLDEGWDWVTDAVRQRSPAAAKVDALKAKWELMMRSDWSSEPNGQETQRRLSTIGFPRSDSEIPLFLQNVREAVNNVDPGGRYRQAARAMGVQPKAVVTGRAPIVHAKK